MHDLKQRISDLLGRVENIKQNFGLDEKKKKLAELEAASMDSNLWDDQEKARKLMQDLDVLKKEIDEMEKIDGEIFVLAGLVKDEEVSSEFSKDIDELGKRLDKVELKSFLSGI